MSTGSEAQVESSAEGFYEAGSGSLVILLHGLTGTWHIWKPVLKLLQAHHRVLAVTLPGHSGGPALSAGTEPTVAVIADQLIAGFAARGISSAHVVGNSIGGWLSLELARRGFAKSVVAFSPAGAWRTAEDYRDVARPFRMIFALMPVLLCIFTWFLGFGWLRQKLAKQSMEHAERIPAGEFRASLHALNKTAVLPGLLKTMGRDGPITPLAAPATPIRIVWGEQDAVIPFERYGRPMLERVPAAECLHMAGVGHVPMFDDPEAVTQRILEMTGAVDAAEASATSSVAA